MASVGEHERKALLRTNFDAVSGDYDGWPLRFFLTSAEHLAETLGLRGDERVLDVACGTGHASLAIGRCRVDA